MALGKTIRRSGQYGCAHRRAGPLQEARRTGRRRQPARSGLRLLRGAQRDRAQERRSFRQQGRRAYQRIRRRRLAQFRLDRQAGEAAQGRR